MSAPSLAKLVYRAPRPARPVRLLTRLPLTTAFATPAVSATAQTAHSPTHYSVSPATVGTQTYRGCVKSNANPTCVQLVRMSQPAPNALPGMPPVEILASSAAIPHCASAVQPPMSTSALGATQGIICQIPLVSPVPPTVIPVILRDV